MVVEVLRIPGYDSIKRWNTQGRRENGPLRAYSRYHLGGFYKGTLISQEFCVIIGSTNPLLREDDMKIKRCVKKSFVVIGKAGSTLDGEGFIQRLWNDANTHFGEIQHLAKKDENGNISGIWGAMSDFSRSFNPWEDFNRGLYLAGVECREDVEAPSGWTKWIVPGYEYIYIECENDSTFSEAVKYLEDNAIPLVGAVHDFTCPQTGKNYLFFPIRKL